MLSIVQKRFNRFVDWIHSGGTRSCHFLQLSAPLQPIHGRRWASEVLPSAYVRGLVAAVTMSFTSALSAAQPDRIAAMSSCDSATSLAAAQAVTREPVSLDASELIVAALALFRNGDLEAGVFWFYAGQLRLRDHLTLHPAEGGIATAMTMAGEPINSFALQDTKKFASIIQGVLDWDTRTPNPLRADPLFEREVEQLLKVRDGLKQFRSRLISDGPALESAAIDRRGVLSRSSWASQIECKE